MEILPALLVLNVAAFVTSEKHLACSGTVQCPCGKTGKNVTVCAADAKDDLCSRLSKCLTCQDGLDRCLECMDDRVDSSCSPETGQPKLSREKRQNYNTWATYGGNPRRPQSSRYQQRPNQGYPTGPVQQRGGFCPDLNSPKLGSIRCLSSNRVRTCVGKCLPGYSFEGRGSENEITLTCTDGQFTPLREFPPCKSGGYCDLIVQGSGSFNCTTGMDGSRCDVICSGRYVGRFFCYPGKPWQPALPHCMRPKEAEICRCEYGGQCDSYGNCVCPVGRTGKNCEIIVQEKQTCPDPGFVTNGFRRYPDESDASVRQVFEEGDSVLYGCNSNEYALQGSSLLTCKSDGTWSKPLPKCVKTGVVTDRPRTLCRDPGVDSNGSRRPRLPPEMGFTPGTQLTYSCNQGYDLEGEKSLFCLVSGIWSSERPKCKTPVVVEKYCPNPGSISNGIITYNPPINSRRGGESPADPEFPEGGRLQYSCNRGYTMEGTEILTCLPDGGWSAPAPSCSKDVIYCPNPGSISNGKITYFPPLNGRRRGQGSSQLDDPEFPEGGRLRYTCDRDYDLEGTNTLTCQPNGRWSASPPSCGKVVTYCPNPGPISNGKIAYHPPINSRNKGQGLAELDDPEFPEGGRLQYTCDRDYTMVDSGSLICQRDGSWSTKKPSCTKASSAGTPVFCPDPGEDPNGRRTSLETKDKIRGWPAGTRLEYSCYQGMDMEGENSLYCLRTGRWSSERPKCKAQLPKPDDPRNMQHCVNPGPILNGQIRYFNSMARPRTGSTSQVAEDTPDYPEGTRLEYECGDGYILEGAFQLKCQSTGDWSDLPPECIADCGRSIMGTTRRILHGNKTVAGEWPWVVAIGTRENDKTKLICGGAVLNTQTIITAAHCLASAKQFVLYFGKYHRNDNLDDDQVRFRISDRLIVHREYNNATMDNDIALVKFKPKITFTDRIQPICLPSADTTTINLKSGSTGYVTGWGDTEKRLTSDVLLMAKLPYVSNKDCIDSFRQNIENFNGSLTQNMFCAGYREGDSQATCRGDSGSPLVFYDKEVERYTLEGLVSFGVQGQCGLPGMYSVFTRVNRFMPWIYTYL